MPDTAQAGKNWRLDRPQAPGKTQYDCSAKEQNNKMIPKDILLYPYQCPAQPSSSEKLPLTVDGNKYRDPQLDNLQRKRGFGTPRPKWNVVIKPLPSGLMELCGRGDGKIVGAREDW